MKNTHFSRCTAPDASLMGVLAGQAVQHAKECHLLGLSPFIKSGKARNSSESLT